MGIDKAKEHNTVFDMNLFLSVLQSAVSVGCNKPEIFANSIKGESKTIKTKLKCFVFLN